MQPGGRRAPRQVVYGEPGGTGGSIDGPGSGVVLDMIDQSAMLWRLALRGVTFDVPVGDYISIVKEEGEVLDMLAVAQWAQQEVISSGVKKIKRKEPFNK